MSLGVSRSGAPVAKRLARPRRPLGRAYAASLGACSAPLCAGPAVSRPWLLPGRGRLLRRRGGRWAFGCRAATPATCRPPDRRDDGHPGRHQRRQQQDPAADAAMPRRHQQQASAAASGVGRAAERARKPARRQEPDPMAQQNFMTTPWTAGPFPRPRPGVSLASFPYVTTCIHMFRQCVRNAARAGGIGRWAHAIA